MKAFGKVANGISQLYLMNFVLKSMVCFSSEASRSSSHLLFLHPSSARWIYAWNWKRSSSEQLSCSTALSLASIFKLNKKQPKFKYTDGLRPQLFGMGSYLGTRQLNICPNGSFSNSCLIGQHWFGRSGDLIIIINRHFGAVGEILALSGDLSSSFQLIFAEHRQSRHKISRLDMAIHAFSIFAFGLLLLYQDFWLGVNFVRVRRAADKHFCSPSDTLLLLGVSTQWNLV